MISLNPEPGGAEHRPEVSPAGPPIDTSNIFAVCAQGGQLLILRPPKGGRLTPAEAMNLAAWLVALAEPCQPEFQKLLEAIRNT